MERAQVGFTKNAIHQLAKDIAVQVMLKPQPSFALNANFDKLASEMKDSVSVLLPQCFSLQNTINSISMSYLSWNAFIDSKILQADLERAMVTAWVADKVIKCTLLYRGSRDGYSYQAFMSKVSNAKPTLTLIEANTSKRFGGFTDQDWTNNSGHKSSAKSFIFSISDKEKYPVRQETQQYAIYTNKNNLPTFGNVDVCLTVEGNSNNNNLTTSVILDITMTIKGSPVIRWREVGISRLRN